MLKPHNLRDQFTLAEDENFLSYTKIKIIIYMYIIYEIWIIFQIRHDKRHYSPISMECDKDVGVATHLHVWMPHNL